MNIIKCKNGHWFDNDEYDVCPHCGSGVELQTINDSSEVKEEKKSFWGKIKKNKEDNRVKNAAFEAEKNVARSYAERTPSASEVVPASEAKTVPMFNESDSSSDDEKTVNFENTGSENNVQSVSEGIGLEKSHEETTNSNNYNEVVEKAVDIQNISLKEAVQKISASNEGKTLSYFSAATAANDETKRSEEPIVGWLVCLKGKHLGESFCIYPGKNSIGRSEDNRIVFPLENSISRHKHALIVYEPKKRQFYIQPGDSSGLTYLNDDYITESHKLSPRDIIELGDSKLLFVPLCGEEFSWEDYV